MRDLGLLDRVVACTKYCADVCPEVAGGERLIVSDSWTSQAEEIREAEADLVIASVPYQLEAVGEILKAGIRFLGLTPRTLADIFADIAIMARVMAVPERGENVVAKMRRAIDDIRARCSTHGNKPKVFCEEWGRPIIASQPWVAELVAAASGEFVGEAGATTSADAVADARPDVLIAAWCGAGDRVPLEKIVVQRHWTELPAARNGRIFCISDELLNTPASSLIGGLNAIAWALYPQQFPQPVGIRKIRSDQTMRTDETINYDTLTRELSRLASHATSAEQLMTVIVERLREAVPHYNWAGFYMLDNKSFSGEPMLVLGPYVGAETPHKRIPLNQGICGAAVTAAQTIVVDDVNADPRYLACSLETKSEIVAPVFVKGAPVGELDIDSHSPAAFTGDDRRLIEHCASLVGRYLEQAL
jgi:iron complex transport system substrate-binding protein